MTRKVSGSEGPWFSFENELEGIVRFNDVGTCFQRDNILFEWALLFHFTCL